jgi:phage FluMu gp28-like protein
MTAVVVKESPAPAELLDWLSTLPGFIQGGTQVDEQPTRLYDYQIALMESTSRFRAILKSRQTGLSFVMAAEALAKTHLKREHTGIFVSYNLSDATEKIRHAAMLYESLPAKWQKKRVTDNKTELEFEDGQGRRTRMISMPCREPRGKGKADVNLDEFPFMRNPRKIYTAAIPIISRGGGSMTLGSTPLGKSDPFFEIMEGEVEKYPLYQRFRVAWWDCPEFCTNVEMARREAPHLTTDERVAFYGTETLKQIRASLDIESFQQEYELYFVDAAAAFIVWELIQAATRDADELPVVRVDAKTKDDISVDRVLTDLNALRISGPLTGGYDVGRRRNASELIVLEQVGSRYRERLHVTLPQTDFDLQEDLLLGLLKRRPDVYRLCIDESGLGMQLAEKVVKAFPGRAEGITFSAPTKSVMAHQLKIDFEGKNLEIAADRDLMQQIHSVRKTITVAGNIRLDTEHDDKHHADMFWALALARHAAASEKPQPFQPAAGGSRPMLSQLDQLGQRRPFGQGPGDLRRGPPRERGY